MKKSIEKSNKIQYNQLPHTRLEEIKKLQLSLKRKGFKFEEEWKSEGSPTVIFQKFAKQHIGIVLQIDQ